MNIVEIVLAKQIFSPGDEKWQDFDHVESRRVLLRLCAFLPILAATVIALEISGQGASRSPSRYEVGIACLELRADLRLLL